MDFSFAALVGIGGRESTCHPCVVRERFIVDNKPNFGLANGKAEPVHRFDPKTGKKMGKSTSKRGIAVMWMKYPKGYKGKAGATALLPAKAKNGVWAVRALGPGQKHTDNFGPYNPRSGELMYFRED